MRNATSTALAPVVIQILLLFTCVFVDACASAKIPVADFASYVGEDSRRDWYVRTRAWHIDATMQHWFFPSWSSATSDERVAAVFDKLLKKHGITEQEYDASYGDRPRVAKKRAVLKATRSLVDLRARQVALDGSITDNQTRELVESSAGVYSTARDDAGAVHCEECGCDLKGSRRALRAHLRLHQQGEFVRLVKEQDGTCMPVEEFVYGRSGQSIIPPTYKQSARLVLPPRRFLADGAEKWTTRQLTCPCCSVHAIDWPRSYQKKVGAASRIKTHERKCANSKKLDLAAGLDPIPECADLEVD
ncbi:unnamed protein product [Amoebophrya sp. A120]|nr:unnamed protein product [Amoebophrya sp. A120]|eukprot:GSA120T00007151001.1